MSELHFDPIRASVFTMKGGNAILTLRDSIGASIVMHLSANKATLIAALISDKGGAEYALIELAEDDAPAMHPPVLEDFSITGHLIRAAE